MTPNRLSPPTVSVVMAVYNGGDDLPATINSILGQTFRDFEFIIVDDGSTDHSARVLSEFAAADHRLRIITQQNSGLTRALIAGCNAASGRYIARQDSGDTSLPERLEKQVAWLDEHPDTVAVSCITAFVGPRGEFLFQNDVPATPQEATNSLRRDRKGPCHPSVMFRQADYHRVGGYRPQFRQAQDHDLWYRLTDHGLLHYIPEILNHYVIELKGISAGRNSFQQTLGLLAHEAMVARQNKGDEDEILARAATLSQQHQPLSQAQQDLRRAEANYFVGSLLLKREDHRATSYLWQAVRARPLNWNYWYKFVASKRLAGSALTTAGGASGP